jgi:D-arabinose 1-dehydrogenase-like Zn-dependent alcohol dehydrogenase
MGKMRAVQVARAGGALEVVERDVPEPKPGEISIRVEACDVCHSDSFTVEGVIGVDAKSIEVSPLQLMSASRSIVGHATGASIDSQDTLAFSSLSGVGPIIETIEIAHAAEAYDRMMRGDARFRMVLTMA